MLVKYETLNNLKDNLTFKEQFFIFVIDCDQQFACF